MTLEDKQRKIIELFKYFCQKHRFNCNLAFGTVTAYSITDNTLIVDIKDLLRYDMNALAWILAHECRHVMQMQHHLLDNLVVKSMRKYKLNKITSWLLAIIMFLVTYTIWKSFIISWFVSGIFFYLIGNRIIFNKDYVLLRREMELDADNFANQEVGTGALVFFNYLHPENKTKHKFWKWLLGYTSRDMYPDPYERVKEASRFSPNKKLLAWINE